jgi:hypothetical protein
VTYHGKYKVRNRDKYKGKSPFPEYKSLWERKMLRFCDYNPAILEWGYESVIIPYISPLDGRQHRYFVDIWLKWKKLNGTIETCLIEIKPKKQTVPPKTPKRRTKRYLAEVMTYEINQAKWSAAETYAKQMGWRFLVFTENTNLPGMGKLGGGK